MSKALDSARQMFLAAQTNLTPALSSTKTPGQHDQVINAYVKLRDSYYACIDKAFKEDDAALQGLETQADAATVSLTKIGEQLADVSKVIGCMTQAAAIAGKIAVLAG